MNEPASGKEPTPRSTYFLRGFVAVATIERALAYPPRVVLSFVLVVGAYLLVHRWVFVAARKRLERVARKRCPRFPAPMLLTGIRVAAFITITTAVNSFWPLAFALIIAAASITLGEIVLLRVLLRRLNGQQVLA